MKITVWSPPCPSSLVCTPVPGKPPIYIAIYVVDIIYFSLDDEQYFCTALSQKVKVYCQQHRMVSWDQI
jgi:hypothetical protein